MPAVLLWRGYRFYFFSNEGSEPPHIHVDRGGSSIKCWLETIEVARNFVFSDREARMIEEKVREERQRFLEAWNDDFGHRS